MLDQEKRAADLLSKLYFQPDAAALAWRCEEQKDGEQNNRRSRASREEKMKHSVEEEEEEELGTRETRSHV